MAVASKLKGSVIAAKAALQTVVTPRQPAPTKDQGGFRPPGTDARERLRAKERSERRKVSGSGVIVDGE